MTLELNNNQRTLNSERFEILYDGFLYDISSFIQVHPGGNVIKFYTQQGEDATQAIQQFHYRSFNKVQLILKSFKKRPATQVQGLLGDPDKLKRHKALTEDFAKLFLELQEEGLFQPSYFHVIFRLVQLLGLLFAASFIGYFWSSSSTLAYLLSCSLGGILCGQVGWFIHEGGHHSLTGKPKVDRFIQSCIFGLFDGLSGGWWSRGHNKHHAMPQRLNHDVDLNTLPFLAHNTKIVKKVEDGKNFWIKYQVWLFLSLDCFLGTLFWQLYISPRNALKKSNFLDLFFILLHWILVLRYFSIPTILIITWMAGNYVFGNFALSHTHLPVTDESTHWVEYAFLHTADIQSSFLVDWWMGYLNFQVIHHLFPTLPQFRSHKVKPRVEALAKKHGLPYHTLSYTEAWVTTLKNFSKVSKELASK